MKEIHYVPKKIITVIQIWKHIKNDV